MNIFDFAEFESFYQKYSPFTPYGKNDKTKRELFTSEEYLNTEYSFIKKFISLLVSDTAKTSSLEYHLKRIPHLNFLENDCYTATNIFEIKKFLFNYKKISEILPEEIYMLFFVKFRPTGLFKKLNLNGNKETFYLSENYSEKLAEIRNRIKHFDKQLFNLKRERLEYIKNNFNLDFRFQNFIVIEEAKVLNMDSNYIYKESYDSSKVLIKPVLPEKYFTLHYTKEELVIEEKQEEKNVITELSSKIKKELKLIKSYIKSIHKFDVILAKAVLAEKYNMQKPVLQEYGCNIEVKEGRSIPVMEHCLELETIYYPLNVLFKNRMIVISGSNMGGKTVVLKTIAFLQVLTQMGFFVPAKEYKTTVFENLHYIGDLHHEHSSGLSSYGMEIFSFIQSCRITNEKALYLIDEFAGTTNSHEAEALITAILNDFSTRKIAYAFLSTHFMNLPEFDEMCFYRMKGLDYKKYTEYYKSKSGYDFIERIKLINSFMQYEIEHDTNRASCYDALKIAEILGLDTNIIKQAKKYLAKK
ncbi:MAG: hypothetical protein K9M56_01385 [Victivallales bacterium]|nr:hypothetical protein [Victivallales bacterium]